MTCTDTDIILFLSQLKWLCFGVAPCTPQPTAVLLFISQMSPISTLTACSSVNTNWNTFHLIISSDYSVRESGGKTWCGVCFREGKLFIELVCYTDTHHAEMLLSNVTQCSFLKQQLLESENWFYKTFILRRINTHVFSKQDYCW